MRSSAIASIVSCIVFASAAATAQAEDNAIGQFGKDVGAGVMQGLKAGLVPQADKDFVMNAASGGMAEVEMARVALDKSSSSEVRKHAQHMINDHTKANDELRRIATAKSLALPDAPNATHKAMVERVRDTPVSEFDRTYIREAGIKAHEEMRALFRNQSSSGADPDLKSFAARTLPIVEEHLTQSERIEDGLRATAR